MAHDGELSELDLPPHIIDLLATLPARVNRRTGAELVTKTFFPVSHRTLERWRLPWQRINGQAVTPTAELFTVAYAQIAAAPVIMGGRQCAPKAVQTA